jgi:SAM-dependent methyltransferase
MSFFSKMRTCPLASSLKGVLARLCPVVKNKRELAFWVQYAKEKGAEPETAYYQKFMMDMGDIHDLSFFDDKICLDLGCGPKGSLTWLTKARAAIGLDPLAEFYLPLGIRQHNMLYLRAPAEAIPLPSEYVDVIFSMNSLDHVDNLPVACAEIRRCLKPGGWFIGSLNLEEPKTLTEPWTLGEEFLKQHLFCGWQAEFYKIRPKIKDDYYKYFYAECPHELLAQSGPKILWCRFKKP